MTRTCSILACGRASHCRGFCRLHYKRLMKHGDPNHRAKRVPPNNRTHGESSVNGKASPEYTAWATMKKRCQNPRDHNYKRYGGRGIVVCDRWLSSFTDFLEDMGHRPSKDHSLDRVDNNGAYEPQNCRWATRKEQVRNRACTRWVVYRGRRIPMAELAEQVGISRTKLRDRLDRGWDIERACHG